MTFDFDNSDDVFPNNVIQLVVARLITKYPNTFVCRRPLRAEDGTQSIGVYPTDWNPDDTSYEFRMPQALVPAGFPTVQVYLINIQSFVKDTSEERGIGTHAVMSKAMRSLLYNDSPLAVGLRSLRVSMDGATEVIQKRKIVRQKFVSNEINAEWLYLSTLQLQIETETK